MGCRIRTTANGYLAYRLRSKLVPGYQSQERTGLRDTPVNRRRLEARARVIADEMKAGSFDYLRWFPHGSKAGRLQPPEPPRQLNLREYAEQTWLPRKVPPLVRAWCRRDYLKHLKNHILPAFGDLPLSDVTPAALETFRAELLKKSLKLKTVCNIMDGTFRAMIRDARVVDKLVAGNPFDALTWQKQPKQKPDPFNEAERDALVDYFRIRRPLFFPFVLSAFWTGARPSELIALRWSDVDTRTRKLMVRRSRTLHEDNAPKTEGSERTIDLAPAVANVLAQIKPLHATDDAFVFMNSDGRPIFGDSFTKHEWHRALRSAGVRPRKFYATRHTFISLALSRGARPKWVAEYVGTSVAMIEKHYGRYIAQADGDQLARLGPVHLGPSVAAETDGDVVPISGVESGIPRAVRGTHRRRNIGTTR
jgi:integrase